MLSVTKSIFSARIYRTSFAKTKPKRSFSMTENERFKLVFANTGTIISGRGIYYIVHFNQSDSGFEWKKRKLRWNLATVLELASKIEEKAARKFDCWTLLRTPVLFIYFRPRRLKNTGSSYALRIFWARCDMKIRPLCSSPVPCLGGFIADLA